MEFKYGVDSRPSFGATILYGLQWLMICIPVVLTSTFVAPAGQTLFFAQKLFAVMGVTMIVNSLFGHRLVNIPNSLPNSRRKTSCLTFTRGLQVDFLFGHLVWTIPVAYDATMCTHPRHVIFIGNT